MTTIGNMTLDELKQLIVELIKEQREGDDFDLTNAELTDNAADMRTVEEVFESIERNRWTPPPGTPSPSQMIREDRTT